MNTMLQPAVLEHAAAFLRKTPWEVSRDAGLLFAAHAAAHEAYGHSPMVSGIDVYHAEVEAWGVKVVPAAGGTPSLSAPLFSEPAAVPSLRALDLERDGRLPLLLDAALRLAEKFPEAQVQVPLAGPFSVAVGLLGFETVLMELAEESDALAVALDFLAEHQAAMARRTLTLGFVPVFYESGAAPPLVSPSAFRAAVAPALEKILAPGREAGSPSACIIGGDLAGVADALFAAGPGMVICPAETDQAAFMREAVKHPNVTVRVNMPASLLAADDERPLFAVIERTLPLAQSHPRGVLGTGVVPYDCPSARVQAAIRFAESLCR